MKNGQSRPVSRVLSRRLVASSAEADIPLRPALLRASSELPGSTAGHRFALPYSLLLRVGLAVPPVSPRARCALTAPFHPCRERTPAVCFLWRCPASRLGWPLASTLPCGARTFLPRVLTAPASARTALTGRNLNASPRRLPGSTSRPPARSPRAECVRGRSSRTCPASVAPRHAAASAPRGGPGTCR